MITAQCPLCSTNLVVGQHPEINQKVYCDICQADLEVIWLYPIQLDQVEGVMWSAPTVLVKKCGGVDINQA